MNAILNFFRRLFNSLFGSAADLGGTQTPSEEEAVQPTTEAGSQSTGGDATVEAPASDPPPQQETEETSSPTAQPETEEAAETATPAADPPAETQAEEEEVPTGPKLEVVLERYSAGKLDVLGKLSVGGQFACFTLEATKAEGTAQIPEGKYLLKLRKEGGRHATYWYKFGDEHKGMLWLKGVPGLPFCDIHIGNDHHDANGGIVVGTQVQREQETDKAREVWYSEQAYLAMYKPIAAHLEQGGHVEIWIKSGA